MLTPSKSQQPRGFTLIESLFGMVILTILLVALFTIISTNLAHLYQSKARSIALQIAQEKLENLKNLPYDSLATQTGTIYPAGTISDNEIILRNNLRFRIHTDIRYVDNDYDGNSAGGGGKPADLYPYDYKKTTIQVFAGTGQLKLAELSSDVAAKAAETSGNTGVLIIRVINAAGTPVEGATVKITNTKQSPNVSIESQTDVQGQLVIPKLPPDSQSGYHVVITKGSYSSEQTYPSSAGQPTPTSPDFGLITQQTTLKTFAIDNLANLKLTVKNQLGNPLINQAVTVRGTKTTFLTPLTYKYQQTVSTNAAGELELNLIEWDSYEVTMSGYTILSSSPQQPIAVAPNSFVNAVIYAATTPTSYPIIDNVNPASSTQISGVEFDISGSNLNTGSTFLLRQAGQTDRPASGISFANNTLSGTLNLSGAATGSWDLIVTTAGRSTTQEKAVSVQP